jgi:hypothetical protein
LGHDPGQNPDNFDPGTRIESRMEMVIFNTDFGRV